MKIFEIFRRKNTTEKEPLIGLEKAWGLKLITEEEFLILREKRATEDVKYFYAREKLKEKK
jgi:hypothetical protein